MSNFLIIFVCLFAGWWVNQRAWAKAFNSFVIGISLPAMIFIQIPRLYGEATDHTSALLPVIMPWLVFGLSWLLFHGLGRRRGWSNAQIGAVVLTAGLGNTSFLGFPLVEALLGREALKWAVLTDQLGSFLTLSTLGLAAAAYYSGRSLGVKDIGLRIVTFAPFIALVAAVIWSVMGTPGQALMEPVCERLGLTLVPLAMFAVGLQLRPKASVFRQYAVQLSSGLVFKLLAAPALILALAAFWFDVHSESARVTVLEAAMAPMISAGVVASEAGLDSELSSLMIGIGIPLSLLTVPLWNLLLT